MISCFNSIGEKTYTSHFFKQQKEMSKVQEYRFSVLTPSLSG